MPLINEIEIILKLNLKNNLILIKLKLFIFDILYSNIFKFNNNTYNKIIFNIIFNFKLIKTIYNLVN